MLTLRDLRKMVKRPAARENVPGCNVLMRSGEIVLRECLLADTELIVFREGYAIYRSGKKKTVFAIADSMPYVYESCEEGETISSDQWEEQPWYLRLVLEGEDRLERNNDDCENRRAVPWGVFSEDWSGREDLSIEEFDARILAEESKKMELMMSLLTERQREIMERFYEDDRSVTEIAKELSITPAAVTMSMKSSYARIRKKLAALGYELEEFRQG